MLTTPDFSSSALALQQEVLTVVADMLTIVADMLTVVADMLTAQFRVHGRFVYLQPVDLTYPK
jgi:hypothetical protein